MVSILGTVSEIRIAWQCKPGLRNRMIRHMMAHKGRHGVEALAKILNMNYSELEVIGGLEGWIRHRNCQRRQRQERQKRKTDCFLVDPYNHIQSMSDIHSDGTGKRGKGGGRQDFSHRLYLSSEN